MYQQRRFKQVYGHSDIFVPFFYPHTLFTQNLKYTKFKKN